MTIIAFLVVMASLVALSAAGTEDIGSGHAAFATNRGINVQTSTTHDQGCEPAGGTSGITNACVATSTPGSTQTTVVLSFESCQLGLGRYFCMTPVSPNNCNNIGCTGISCEGTGSNAVCTTSNSFVLTSCALLVTSVYNWTCTLTEPGTGSITNSGGVTGDDALKQQ